MCCAALKPQALSLHIYQPKNNLSANSTSLSRTMTTKALARLQAILSCFPCISTPEYSLSSYSNEKLALLSSYRPRAITLVADDVVTTLLSTALVGPALHMQLDTIVGAAGWTENLARWILEKLSLALQNAHDNLGPAIRGAYHKALEAARGIEGFVIEHPVFCTVIALGVLVSTDSSMMIGRDSCMLTRHCRSLLRHGSLKR
jgi:hypothetical protein